MCAVAGSGPDLVLLHPVGLDHTFMMPWLAQAGRGHRVVAVDLRGHGDSPAATRDTTLDDYVADIGAAMSAHCRGPATVLGLSFGGMLAQLVALAHPESVARLVLCGCTGGFAPEVRTILRERGVSAERSGMAGVVEATLDRWFTPSFRANEAVERVRTRLLADDVTSWSAAWHAMATFDALPRLSRDQGAGHGCCRRARCRHADRRRDDARECHCGCAAHRPARRTAHDADRVARCFQRGRRRLPGLHVPLMEATLNHVVHRGLRSTPALLLIHPLGGDLTFWDECIAHWQPALTCIACDLRSAGASPRATEPVTCAQHARDLEALRQLLGFESVVPVGCAIGSMVAAAYAARYPDRVPALVLSNPALKTTGTARAMLRDRAAAVRTDGMKAILPGAVDRAFLDQPRDDRYRRYFGRFAAQDPEAYALSIRAVLDADASADLVAVRCPTLVVAGAHDVLLPPEQSRAVHALVRHGQFKLLADAAHFSPLQQPNLFAELVLDFLRRVEDVDTPRHAASTGAAT